MALRVVFIFPVDWPPELVFQIPLPRIFVSDQDFILELRHTFDDGLIHDLESDRLGDFLGVYGGKTPSVTMSSHQSAAFQNPPAKSGKRLASGLSADAGAISPSTRAARTIILSVTLVARARIAPRPIPG